MPGTDETQRAVGRLEGRLDAVETSLESVSGKVDILLSAVAEAKGGWKVLVMIGGLGGVAGAVVTKIVPFLAVLR